MLTINATMIAVVINFIILVYVLNYFLYKPVMKLLNDRKTHVENTLAEADAKMSQAKASVEEGLQVINSANLTAKKIIADASAASAKIKSEEKDKMRKEIEQQRKRAKEEINQYKLEARASVTREAAKLSVMIAEKILRRKMTVKAHRSMIDEFVNKAGS